MQQRSNNAANNQVDQIVNQGNTAIGAANTTEEVNEARDHGIQELQNIAPDVVKNQLLEMKLIKLLKQRNKQLMIQINQQQKKK